MADSLLSAKERVQIRTYNSVGLTNEEIAEKVGVTIRDVEIEIQRQGLKEHVREAPQPHAFAKPKVEEQPKSEAKEEKSAISWTDDKVAKIKEMYFRGESNAEIAKAFGTTKNAIGNKIFFLKKSGVLPAERGKPEPKKKAATANPEFEEAVNPMPIVPMKHIIPKYVRDVTVERLEVLKHTFKKLEKDYFDRKQEISELEVFLREVTVNE